MGLDGEEAKLGALISSSIWGAYGDLYDPTEIHYASKVLAPVFKL